MKLNFEKAKTTEKQKDIIKHATVVLGELVNQLPTKDERENMMSFVLTQLCDRWELDWNISEEIDKPF